MVGVDEEDLDIWEKFMIWPWAASSGMRFLFCIFAFLSLAGCAVSHHADLATPAPVLTDTNRTLSLVVDNLSGRSEFKPLIRFDSSANTGSVANMPVSRIRMKRAGKGLDYDGPMDDFLYDMPFLAVVDENEKKIRVFHERFGDRDFFYYDGDQFLHFMVSSQAFIVRTNYLLVNFPTNNLDSCMAQLKQMIGQRKLTGKSIVETDRRVEMRPAAPAYFFSDVPAPGGELVMVQVKSLGVKSGLLNVIVENPMQHRTAEFSIDVKSMKIVASVVDGRPMAIGTNSLFAFPK